MPDTHDRRRVVSDPQAGFTLLEALVAITLLSFAFTLLFGGLRLGTRVWEVTGRTADELSDLQAVHRLMSGLLARAFPLSTERDGKPVYVFSGAAEEVRFAVFMPPYPDAPGFYAVSFLIEEDGEAEQLWVKRSPLSPEAADEWGDEATAQTLLLQTSNRLRFSFHGRQREQVKPEWHERWDDPDWLPELIKLEIVRGDDDASAWPSLVVPLRINMDTSCLNSAIPGKCRLLD